MTERSTTEFIAVHCSATKHSMDIGEQEIDEWHRARGWDCIGYNAVIRRNGLVEIGRPLDHRGAHVKGFNSRSVGVCLVGGINDDGDPVNNFTLAQFDSLADTIGFFRRIWPLALVLGHRDFPGVTKACPCFNVSEFVTNRGI